MLSLSGVHLAHYYKLYLTSELLGRFVVVSKGSLTSVRCLDRLVRKQHGFPQFFLVGVPLARHNQAAQTIVDIKAPCA